MTQFCPKFASLVILGQALPDHYVPFWWVGWWLRRAGCISQDTYLLYQIAYLCLVFSNFSNSFRSLFIHLFLFRRQNISLCVQCIFARSRVAKRFWLESGKFCDRNPFFANYLLPATPGKTRVAQVWSSSLQKLVMLGFLMRWGAL